MKQRKIAVILAGLLLLAGCGNSIKNEYGTYMAAPEAASGGAANAADTAAYDYDAEKNAEVTDEKLRNKIKDIIQLTLKDTVKARVQQPDDIRYKRIDKRGKELIQSQLAFYAEAKKYYKDYKKEKTKDVFIPVSSH